MHGRGRGRNICNAMFDRIKEDLLDASRAGLPETRLPRLETCSRDRLETRAAAGAARGVCLVHHPPARVEANSIGRARQAIAIKYWLERLVIAKLPSRVFVITHENRENQPETASAGMHRSRISYVERFLLRPCTRESLSRKDCLIDPSENHLFVPPTPRSLFLQY